MRIINRCLYNDYTDNHITLHPGPKFCTTIFEVGLLNTDVLQQTFKSLMTLSNFRVLKLVVLSITSLFFEIHVLSHTLI